VTTRDWRRGERSWKYPAGRGSQGQVWHCVAFSEGAQYGIELFILSTSRPRKAACFLKVIGAKRWRAASSGLPCEISAKAFTPISAAERETQARRIHARRPKLAAGTEWTSSSETVFDGIYRHLHRAPKINLARIRMHRKIGLSATILMSLSAGFAGT
jgi:hypothetical protein